MSAIGDYVHYSAIGYINHGTTVRGQPDSFAAMVFNAQRSKIIQSQIDKEAFTPQERADLENAITQLMRPVGSDEEIAAINELWNEMIKAFEAEFQNDIAGRISRSTANISSSNPLMGVEKIRKSTGGGVRYSTILTRIGQINNSIQLIPNSKSKQELITRVDEIYSMVSELSGETREILASTGYDLETKKATGQMSINSRMYTWDEAGNVLAAINRLAAKSKGAAGLQKGTLFEYIIAVAPLVGQGGGLKRLQEAISHVVGTSGKSKVIFDANDFAPAVNLQQVLGKKYEYNANENLYSTTIAAQDKVDVELTFNEKSVGVSAKNINLQSGFDIHLLSGASMLSLLANIGTDYTNHYLNVVATNGNYMLGSLINLAHESFKVSALLLAFEGYRNGAAKANVFIVNDNTTGRVRVYNIADLILAATSTINSYAVTANGGPIESIQLKNEWNEEGYPGRITELLASVHAQKISVTLSPSLL